MVVSSRVDEARIRSGRTKKRRTREALLEAATGRFTEHGWEGTRIEDVARDADVGVATAYTHFSKQTLIGHVYAPLIQPLLDTAAQEIADQRNPTEALARHVGDLASLVFRHRNLTIALLHAVQEHTLAAGGPPTPGDLEDVRVIVPAPRPMAELIAYGQAVEQFSSEISAEGVASYHTNAAFLHLMTRPSDSPSESARIVLSQLLPPLVAARRECTPSIGD